MHVFKIVGSVFAVIIPIFLLFSAFWVWMIIDVINRKFNDKTQWILIVIFLNFIGACLYFFMIRKELVNEDELSGNV